jgi:hypothetical protein
MRSLEEEEEAGDKRRRRRKPIQSNCDERGGASFIRIKGDGKGGLRARPCDVCV